MKQLDDYPLANAAIELGVLVALSVLLYDWWLSHLSEDGNSGGWFSLWRVMLILISYWHVRFVWRAGVGMIAHVAGNEARPAGSECNK